MGSTASSRSRWRVWDSSARAVTRSSVSESDPTSVLRRRACSWYAALSARSLATSAT